MPVSQEVLDEAIENAVTEGVASYTSDGETTVAIDPLKLIAIANHAAARQMSGSGFKFLRKARAVPGGGGPD